ncbi:MAG: ribonuclease HII [Cyanobacteria bacterium]|nr:ribonuclease HII [Cyanobacteriota bacterium]
MSGGQLDLFTQTAVEHVIGVDEVGRGCLAGPVVACAVILPSPLLGSELYHELAELNDSKMLSESVRNALSASIRQNALWAVAEASIEEIDTINILWASLLAMRRAVATLTKKQSLKRGNCLVLVDGNRPIKSLSIKQLPVIKGDSTSASIAAASVVAKVYRDELMTKLSAEYPAYGWESNKGYGSKVHRDAIVEFGMTPLHRRSFRCVPEEE